MKKLISMILALALILSLSTAAFAAESGKVEESGGKADVTVTGTYVPGTTASGTVFSVDIEWSGMSFTYNAEKASVWDPINHVYSETTPASWEGQGEIKVTNHSNAKILANSAYVAAEGYESATMIFGDASMKIASAEVGTEQIGTITVKPDGSLPATANGGTIGTITVTIEQDTEITLEDAQALYNKALDRRSDWEAAGYTDEAQILINKLQEVVAGYQAIENGNYDASVKPNVDQAYTEALEDYNELEALTNN